MAEKKGPVVFAAGWWCKSVWVWEGIKRTELTQTGRGGEKTDCPALLRRWENVQLPPLFYNFHIKVLAFPPRLLDLLQAARCTILLAGRPYT